MNTVRHTYTSRTGGSRHSRLIDVAKYLAIAGATLATLGISAPALSANYGTVCQDCTAAERQTCAFSTAVQLNLSGNDEVWVLDLENVDAGRFEVNTRGDGQVPSSAFNSETGVNSVVEEVLPISFTSQHWNYISGGIQFFNNLVLPNGGQVYQECITSSRGEIVAETVSQTQGTSPGIIDQYTLPGFVFDSAYDVIGNTAAGVSVGQWWENQHTFRPFLAEGFTLFNSLTNTVLDSEVALVVTFEDGSTGVWRANPERDQWEADFDTFRDSDGNPIPVHPDDVQPGDGFLFGGDAAGQTNMNNFFDRLDILGIPVTAPDSGSGTVSCVGVSPTQVVCTRIQPE